MKRKRYFRIKASDFLYGKVSKSLKNAIVWLNRVENQEYIKNNFADFFDFPYYWGMPKNITRWLGRFLF